MFNFENLDYTTKEDIKSVSEWLRTDVHNLEFTKIKEPISNFLNQIHEMYSTYSEFPEDEERTFEIMELLKNGEEPLPIYVELGDNSKFVMEGRHRMVAFWLLGMETIEVNYAKIKN